MFGRKVLKKHVDFVLKSIKVFDKPCFIVLEKEDDLSLEALRKDVEELYNEMGVVTFPDVSLAARIMNRMKTYNDYLLATRESGR
jgi:hypothetical protein